MEFFPFGTEIAQATSATLASLAVPNGPSGIEGETPRTGLTVRVSPSPASVSVSVKTAKNSVITVFDTGGRMVLREQAPQGTATLDVSGFPPGIYHISATSDGEWGSGRVVICR